MMSFRSTRRLIAVLATLSLAAAAPVLTASNASALTTHTVSSPNGSLAVTVTNQNDGTITYRVTAGTTTIFGDSPLGLTTTATDFTTGMSFLGEGRRTLDTTYSLPAGTKSSYRDNANELTLSYSKSGRTLQLVLRAYDDGIAFRYALPGTGPLTLTSERSGFRLPTQSGGWASEWRQDYEGDYVYRSPAQLNTSSHTMPLLASINNNAYFTLISEASVLTGGGSYVPSLLEGSGASDGLLRVGRTPDQAFPLTTSLPFQSPWRTAIIANSLDTLVNSDLGTDLNSPSAPADLSWVRPGRAAWSWYTDEPSANDVNKQKRYIDFAESMGFEYVTVDCCYTKSDLPVMAAYARQHNVKLFAWVTAESISTPALADAEMALLKSYGIAGLKVDFFLKDDQQRTAWYKIIADAGARNQMMLNFHGSTKPGGEERTWPWLITSEAVRGIEHYKYPPPPSARLNVTLPFTRNPLGGMDYTPVVISENNATTTQAHALAQSVVFTSAMLHLSDSAAAYEQWPGRHLLRAVPTTWAETRVIEGFPGSHITIARRNGDTWYIGAMTDASRTASVPLAFLGAGTYTATLFTDDSSGRVQVSTQQVSNTTTLTLPLRSTGGAAIHLSRIPLPLIGSADTRYEAEAANNNRSGGVTTDACAGCSGATKVGNLGFASSVLFNGVQAATTGTHRISLTYAAGDSRTVQIQVNGAAPLTRTLPTTGGWNVVSRTDFDVPLNQGPNTVRVSNPNGYAPDIDAITVSRQTEAEAAGNQTAGGAASANCTGCSNGQKVGYIGQGATLTFTNVSVTTAGNKTVRIAYATADARQAQVSVNGVNPTTVSFPPSGSYDQTASRTVGLNLNAGVNTITISNTTGYAPDIDSIAVND